MDGTTRAQFLSRSAKGGLALVAASILKTWWDSRLSFFSGIAYLLVLNAVYLLLRKSHRERTIAR